MESIGGASRVYQDFEPSMEWVPEDDSDTLLVFLPGFAKEQLRVQLRARDLIISGERKLAQNTWSRFRVEFPVSGNCDLNKISAKFEGNILFVKQPKLIIPESKPEDIKPVVVPAPVPTPQKPVDESNNGGQKAAEIKPKRSDVEKKEVGKNEDDVHKTAEDVSKEDKSKKELYGELDKTLMDKYKQAVGAFGMKLKTCCNGVNTIVVLVVGLAIAIYVSDLIKSWTN